MDEKSEFKDVFGNIPKEEALFMMLFVWMLFDTASDEEKCQKLIQKLENDLKESKDKKRSEMNGK